VTYISQNTEVEFLEQDFTILYYCYSECLSAWSKSKFVIKYKNVTFSLYSYMTIPIQMGEHSCTFIELSLKKWDCKTLSIYLVVQPLMEFGQDLSRTICSQSKETNAQFNTFTSWSWAYEVVFIEMFTVTNQLI